MVDCIIVGSGFAGISAALTLKNLGKNFLLLGSSELSGKITAAEKIPNYPAVSYPTGKELNAALKHQLKEAEITVTEERAVGVYAMKGSFTVMTDGANNYEAKTVILATGVNAVKPVEGEEAFVGRGVSYCATCDGFLYKGKTIAVVCTSERFEHEIEYLASLAGKIYLLPLYKGKKPEKENIETILAAPEAIEGGLRVKSMRLKNGRTLEVDGVFMLKESVSPAVLVGGLETENGHVKITRNTETNIAGCFAAGDCTGRPYQYVKAAGEGNVAAHAVAEYLAKIQKELD